LATSTTLGELKLTFADLFQVSATLDEGFILGEDAIVLVPASLAGASHDTALNLVADLLPLLAALNALVKVTHALLDITAKHVLAINLLSASLVDLVANLGQKALHALGSSILLAELPDDTHA